MMRASHRSMLADFGRQPGQSLLEVMVALGILVMIIAALARFIVGASADVQWSREQIAAAFYAQEGLEAVQSIAERRFEELSPGTHGLNTASGFYTLSGTSNAWAPYLRSITVAAVQRDGAGNIVASEGSADDNARLVTTEVTWPRPRGGVGIVSFLQYVTSWQKLLWLIDTFPQFTTGARNSTASTNVRDGEVQLRSLEDLDYPVSHLTVDIAGNADVMSLAIDRDRDELFLTTGNQAGGDELFVYDTSNITGGTMPLLRSADVGNTSRGLAIGPDYVFILSHDTAREVRVIRRRDMALIAEWDLPSNASPNAILLDSSIHRVYVGMKRGAGGEFYMLDVANPAVFSPIILAEVEVGKDVTGVAVGLGHAYLTTTDADGELRIVNLADANVQATCDLPGNQDGQGVELHGNRLFITRDVGSEAEFAEYTVDVANPRNCAYILAHRPVSTQIGDTPLAFTVDMETNRAFITVADTGDSLLIFNLTSLTSHLTTLASATMCDAVMFLGSHIYIGCRDNEKTLQLLRGRSGGGSFSFWGTYTAPAFDGGGSAITWGAFSATEAGNGITTYRIRTASTQEGLTNALWVGSDGTEGTVFQGDGETVVPSTSASGTRWIQWKAYLTGDGTQTPSVDDVTISLQ